MINTDYLLERLNNSYHFIYEEYDLNLQDDVASARGNCNSDKLKDFVFTIFHTMIRTEDKKEYTVEHIEDRFSDIWTITTKEKIYELNIFKEDFTEG